jgi:hypothetical protein
VEQNAEITASGLTSCEFMEKLVFFRKIRLVELSLQ